MQVTLDEAILKLNVLMVAACGGEAVVIVHAGAAVQLVPVPIVDREPLARKAGGGTGQVGISPDFDAPIADFAEFEQ